MAANLLSEIRMLTEVEYCKMLEIVSYYELII